MIAQLKLFLDRQRASSGNPSEGFIFRNLWENPLNLGALLGEVIQPALEAEKIPWSGRHAFRRGLRIFTGSASPTKSFSRFCDMRM